jgi:nucleoside-diphosphate-sugar epimerase
VGWSPQFDLDSGLARTIMWWKHQLTGEGEMM